MLCFLLETSQIRGNMKKTDKELQEAMQQLLRLYAPSVNACKPYIIHNGEPNEGSLTTLNEGILACMLAGYKDVGFANFNDDELLAELATWQGITIVGDVCYTQNGKYKAELLLHAKETQATELLDGNNHYFYGYILGYSDDDILGFYQWLYEQDRRDAIAWIEQQKDEARNLATLLEKAQAGNLTIVVQNTEYHRAEIPYLVAVLSGVPEDEIKSMYYRHARQRFERDKKRAMAWINGQQKGRA